MRTSRLQFGRRQFARYDTPGELSQWPAQALASIIKPEERYVLAIDCADRWLFRNWGTKLVLTTERVVACRADPANPMKRSYRLKDISEVKYDTGRFTDEVRFIGNEFYEVYTVPKHLGPEFVDAVENAHSGDRMASIQAGSPVEPLRNP